MSGRAVVSTEPDKRIGQLCSVSLFVQLSNGFFASLFVFLAPSFAGSNPHLAVEFTREEGRREGGGGSIRIRRAALHSLGKVLLDSCSCLAPAPVGSCFPLGQVHLVVASCFLPYGTGLLFACLPRWSTPSHTSINLVPRDNPSLFLLSFDQFIYLTFPPALTHLPLVPLLPSSRSTTKLVHCSDLPDTE